MSRPSLALAATGGPAAPLWLVGAAVSTWQQRGRCVNAVLGFADVEDVECETRSGCSFVENAFPSFAVILS